MNSQKQPGRSRAVTSAVALLASVVMIGGSGSAIVDDGAALADVGVPSFVPVEPARFLDTRAGGQTFDGAFAGTGPVPDDAVVRVLIAGRGQVPGDASGILATVTVVDPAAVGFATLYACNEPRPNVSTLNFAVGQVVANHAVIPIAADGSVCVFTSAAGNVLLDVTGYVPSNSHVGVFTPHRYLDTRASNATFDGVGSGGGKLRAGSILSMPVAGRGDVPDDATAVFANVTAVDPDDDGFVTVFPCGSIPPTSTLNHRAAETVPNGVLSLLSAEGELCVFSRATSHIVVDVTAFVPAGISDLSLRPAERFVDTRLGAPTVDGVNAASPPRFAAGQTVEVQIAGRGGVPATATAAFVNVVTVAAEAAGFVTLFACGQRPGTSNVNTIGAGTVRANNAFVALSPAGTLCVFTSTATDLVLDVTGSITPPVTTVPPPGTSPTQPTTTTTIPTTSSTTSPTTGECARETSLPQPGDFVVNLNLTGRVVMSNGEPVRDGGGFVVVRDLRSTVGDVLAEASVNDAGFFLALVDSNSVPAALACREYVLEICAPASCAAGNAATLTARRDITDLITAAAGQGSQDLDISADPLIYGAP